MTRRSRNWSAWAREIVPVALPFRFADVAASNMLIMAAESYAILHELIDDEQAPLDPHVRPRIAGGRDITARAYIEALQTARSDEAEVRRGARRHRRAADTDDADHRLAAGRGRPDHDAGLLHALRQLPGPVRRGAAQRRGAGGLPTSLQIVCRGCDEATALRIGWAYQNATEWHLRRPPV